MKCFKIIFFGRVQGVFFRANAKRKADELGLKGYAKNLDNGSVEVIMQGDEANVEILIDFLKKEDFLSPDDEGDFILACMTRHCVIHNGHKKDSEWDKAYTQAKHVVDIEHDREDLYGAVKLPQVEEWHKLFLKITEKIKNTIIASQSKT